MKLIERPLMAGCCPLDRLSVRPQTTQSGHYNSPHLILTQKAFRGTPDGLKRSHVEVGKYQKIQKILINNNVAK